MYKFEQYNFKDSLVLWFSLNNILRSIPRYEVLCSCTAVLSLHTALPCGDRPAPRSRPVLCLPTSYILLSLQQKKHQFPKFPKRTARSLARGRPKMAARFHFDRRLHSSRPSTDCSKPKRCGVLPLSFAL